MTASLVRAYICADCGQPRTTKPGQRGPVPVRCPECRETHTLKQHRDSQNERRALVRDPFNSTPGTAPVPQAPPPVEKPAGDAPPYRPGPIELQLQAELARVTNVNPTAGTLAAVALKIARAADMADPYDIKTTLTASKELRAVLEQINKAPQGGDDDDDRGIFGAMRPEVVNATAV